MKVLCDVHIAKKVAKFLSSKNIEAVHVNDILDSWNTKDQKIAEFADQNDFVVLTKDADFKISHLIKNTPRKLIKVNLGNISTLRLIELLSLNLEFLIENFHDDRCIIEINSDSLEVIKL